MMSTTPTAEELSTRFAGKSLYDVLHYALHAFGDGLRIASSMGVEDMVVLHEADRAGKSLGRRPQVFLLDTGRLHQETYDLVDRVRQRYDVQLNIYAPQTDALERLLREKGPNSFYASIEDRKACCGIRKVEPLGRALADAEAWVTGLRRDQASTRADVHIFEPDDGHRSRKGAPLLKVNPLAAWTSEDVWQFVKENDIPTHELHARGYPSIGCAPCTRAVQPGEDPRAGRWWWEDAAQKECGLHSPKHLAALAARKGT